MNLIYRGQTPPLNTNAIWVIEGKIKIFQNGGWKEISGSGIPSTEPEEYLSETSRNLIKNRAVYNQYMDTDDILDIPAVFDSVYRNVPLTFKILEDGDIVWSATAAAAVKTIEYSKNGGEWTSITSTTSGVSIPVVKGDEVQFRGDNAGYAVKVGTAWKRSNFKNSTCSYDVEGNIMSMISSNSWEELNTITGGAAFIDFFRTTKVINAKNLYLPALIINELSYTQLFTDCNLLKTSPRVLPAEEVPLKGYSYMFKGCTSLETAPKIEALTLGERACDSMFMYCYLLKEIEDFKFNSVGEYACSQMFQACFNLISAPAIPATVLSSRCYQGMFIACTSLKIAPKLPATTLATYCYYSMFGGCESLEETPDLPAVSLADYCYRHMFCIEYVPLADGSYKWYNCKNLKKVKNLPATTLANYCYSDMFGCCENLTEIPTTLPATTLAEGCYQFMFAGCSSLNIAPQLPATTLAVGCYYCMFETVQYAVSSVESPVYNGAIFSEAPVLPAKTLANYCYREMFSGCKNLSKIECYATDVSATNCTTDWVEGVAESGTFVTNAGTEWTIGVNGIPEGWDTELDYSSSYFTMEFVNGGNIQLRSGNYGETQTITVWYRVNGGEWFTWTSNPSATNISTKSFNTGDRVEFKYTGTIQNDYGRPRFSSPSEDLARIKIYGNIMSLVDGDNFTNSLVLTNTKKFTNLFGGWKTVVDAENLVLPATTLYQNCYGSMFAGCSNLAKAPKTLPATTLVSSCYERMFEGTAVAKSPEILGENYTSQCMNWMFSYCSNLIEININILRNELDYLDEFAYGVETKGTLTIPKESTIQNAQLQSAIPSGWKITRI